MHIYIYIYNTAERIAGNRRRWAHEEHAVGAEHEPAGGPALSLSLLSLSRARASYAPYGAGRPAGVPAPHGSRPESLADLGGCAQATAVSETTTPDSGQCGHSVDFLSAMVASNYALLLVRLPFPPCPGFGPCRMRCDAVVVKSFETGRVKRGCRRAIARAMAALNVWRFCDCAAASVLRIMCAGEWRHGGNLISKAEATGASEGRSFP